MRSTLSSHWREYLSEAAAIGVFMLSATAVATLLQHPASPLAHLVPASAAGRLPMGLAMGVTAIALIYSPLGRRSGAHMNPAVTLTFFRLGKIGLVDAGAYVAAQSAGALAGSAAAVVLLRGLPADPAVNLIATVPGAQGPAVAFMAEAAISFGMMLTVLLLSNRAATAPFTGLAAGALVALYILMEAPLSGMSMNPARSLAPAILSGHFASLWIYMVAPPLGMLSAAELYVGTDGLARVRCAKLNHVSSVRCIFHCHYAEPSETHA